VTAQKPGRPSKLTPQVAVQLAEQLGAGAAVGEAARAVGVSRRTLQLWRARAYSSRPEDQPYVSLERRIQRAVAAHRPRATPWEEAAAWLEAEHPERWGLRESDIDEAVAALNTSWRAD
jgi:Transposase